MIFSTAWEGCLGFAAIFDGREMLNSNFEGPLCLNGSARYCIVIFLSFHTSLNVSTAVSSKCFWARLNGNTSTSADTDFLILLRLK